MAVPEVIYECILKARCFQLYYASCINENCSIEERKLFQELAFQSGEQVIRINDFCIETYGINIIPLQLHKRIP